MDDLTRDFASETLDMLDVVERALLRARPGEGERLYSKAFRLLHTVKGTCGFLNLPKLEALAHEGEDQLAALENRIGSPGADLEPLLANFEQIRAVLSHLVNCSCEPAEADPIDFSTPMGLPDAHVSAGHIEQLMADVAELQQVSTQLIVAGRRLESSALHASLQGLTQIVGSIENRIAKATMQPIEAAWRHAPRVARQIAGAQDKLIHVAMSGGETLVDRGMFSVMREIVVHLVRNAAAHGIEPRAERLAAGKAEQGLITLSAREQAGSIILTVSDDGRGMDGSARGVGSASERVTHISGRGVGLAAVHAAVEQAGGRVSIESRPGAGASFEVSLPLVLAMVPCLMVTAGGMRFALPQVSVLEVVRAPSDDSEVIGRYGAAPVLALGAYLALQASDVAQRLVAICEAGGKRVGLLMDTVAEREALVLKPLSFASDGLRPFAAAAIASDGAVVMVLDVGHFASVAGRAVAETAILRTPARKVKLLAFESGEGAKVVRLSDIKRVCLHGQKGAPPQVMGAQPGEGETKTPVLVLEGPEGDVGLPVARVGDVQVVDETVLPPSDEDGPGYTALKLSEGETVELLNPSGLLRDMMPEPEPAGVLLLEPDTFCRELLVAVLQAAGHRVHALLPGETLARRARPAAAVVDLDDGWAASVLAELPQFGDGTLARIGISSRLDGEAARRARLAGITTIIGKFDRAALRNALLPRCGAEIAA